MTEASGAPAEPSPSPQPKPSADPRAGYPEMYAPGKFYLSARHKGAVQGGDQKGFAGTKSQADDAALIQWEIEDEQAEQSAAVPSF